MIFSSINKLYKIKMTESFETDNQKVLLTSNNILIISIFYFLSYNDRIFIQLRIINIKFILTFIYKIHFYRVQQ